MHVVDTSKENQLIWADSIRSSEYYLKYKENVARGRVHWTVNYPGTQSFIKMV